MKGTGEGISHEGGLKEFACVLSFGLFGHALEFGMTATKRNMSSTPGMKGVGGFSGTTRNQEQGIGRSMSKATHDNLGLDVFQR